MPDHPKASRQTPPLVQVDWLDSISAVDQTWFDEGELEDKVKELGAERLSTVGYLIHKSDSLYFFAASLHYGDDGEVTQWGKVFVIPVGCVFGMTVLKGESNGVRGKRSSVPKSEDRRS